MVVYKITNKITNRAYIGQTIYSVAHRWSQHKHAAIVSNSGTYFHKAIRKYGTDCWDLSVLEIVSSKELLSKSELFWILKTKKTQSVYNLTSETNVSSRKWTEEEKKNRHKPCKPSEIKCLDTGVVFGSIRIAAKTMGLKETSISSVLNGRKNSIKGYVFEYLDANKKARAEEIKEKRHKNAKDRNVFGLKIIDNNTGSVFSSIKQAAKFYGLSHSTVGRFLREGHGKCNNLNISYFGG